jgi:hypothetical protein
VREVHEVDQVHRMRRVRKRFTALERPSRAVSTMGRAII